MKVKAWVEAMNHSTVEWIDIPLTLAEWEELTEKEKQEYIEDWAFNEIQMGYGYTEVEE